MYKKGLFMANKRTISFNKNKELNKKLSKQPELKEVIKIKKVNDSEEMATEVLSQQEIDALLNALSSKEGDPKKYELYPKGQKQTYSGTSKPHLLIYIHNNISNSQTILINIIKDFLETDTDYSEITLKEINTNSYISFKYLKNLFLLKPVFLKSELIPDKTDILILLYYCKIIKINKSHIELEINEDYSVIKISDELSLYKLKKELSDMITVNKYNKKDKI